MPLASVMSMPGRRMRDPAYLSRLFREHAGQTASSYLAERRLQIAVDILVTSDQALDAVAEQCGYADAATFGKAFKRRFGKPRALSTTVSLSPAIRTSRGTA